MTGILLFVLIFYIPIFNFNSFNTGIDTFNFFDLNIKPFNADIPSTVPVIGFLFANDNPAE